VGKFTGDQKTVAAGRGEQKVGKVQNAVGGLKDTVRDIQKALSNRRATPFRIHRRLENPNFNGASP
jgi:hypothetical protein